MSGIEESKAALVREGYVVVKAQTYRRVQERARIAEAQRDWEIEAARHARQWAEQAFREQTRLSDRLSFVYGEARAAGCTVEQLQGSEVSK